MVYLLDQQLIVFYVLTLKLRETIEANVCKPQAKPIVMPFLPSLRKSNPETKPDHTPQLPPPPPPLDSPWIISIIEKINQARKDEASSTWDTQSIYRVPKSLRDVDPTAYTPKIVSIGPYHRGCHHLSAMDRHKWRSLHRVLVRNSHHVSIYLEAASSLEGRARSCYEAPISMSSDDFVETLVLDSIFVLELIRGVASDEGFEALGYSPNDPVFSGRGIINSLQHDIIMLENQLPLFVLDCILALQNDIKPSGSFSVAPLVLDFFKNLMPTKELRTTAFSDPLYKADSSGEALHCLDVFRRSLLPFPTPASRPSFRSEQSAWPVELASPMPFSDADERRSDADERRLQLIHCVTDLRNAGIKFRRRIGVPFWDIEFKDGVLYIPLLFIQDGTKSLFLNLIAFEQCHLKCDNHITSYIIFMDDLINSDVDVGYLHDKKIIEHGLGSDKEVADMFNRLCKEVVSDINDCYLLKLSEQVNLYYSNKWNTWRASFNHKYFSNPWVFISLMAAVVLLLLTVLQTVYTVYPYFKSK